MKIILLGCGYLGYNLASLLSQKAETEVIGLPVPTRRCVPTLKKSTPFRLKISIKSILKTPSSSIPFRCSPTTPAARMRKKHSAELKKNTNFCYVS